MSQILKQKQPTLIKSSKYRDTVLEFVDMLRTKGYKYEQTRYEYADIRNKTRVCAMGLYHTEKYGGAYTHGPEPLPERSIAFLNDFNSWTFNQIADELERGVSLLR